MTQNEAIQKSIDHWKEMIEWAGNQEPEGSTHNDEMKDAINMLWGGKDCTLCKLYHDNDNKCPKCPLQKKYGGCCGNDVENEWDKVYESDTWGEWLIHARLMYLQLKSLLPSKNQAYGDLVAVCNTAITMIRTVITTAQKELS